MFKGFINFDKVLYFFATYNLVCIFYNFLCRFSSLHCSVSTSVIHSFSIIFNSNISITISSEFITNNYVLPILNNALYLMNIISLFFIRYFRLLPISKCLLAKLIIYPSLRGCLHSLCSGIILMGHPFISKVS